MQLYFSFITYLDTKWQIRFIILKKFRLLSSLQFEIFLFLRSIITSLYLFISPLQNYFGIRHVFAIIIIVIVCNKFFDLHCIILDWAIRESQRYYTKRIAPGDPSNSNRPQVVVQKSFCQIKGAARFILTVFRAGHRVSRGKTFHHALPKVVS